VYLTRSNEQRGLMFHQNGQLVLADSDFSVTNAFGTGMFNIYQKSGSVGLFIVQKNNNSNALVIEPTVQQQQVQ